MVTQVTKTVDDAILEAQFMVNDAVQPYRNQISTLMEYLNTALRVVYAIRPDAYIGNFSSGIISTTTINTYAESDLGQTPPTSFPLDDKLFYYPVVAYIAARVELADDEFTETSRSQQLMQSFVAQLQGI
jgi:hypothetical protein